MKIAFIYDAVYPWVKGGAEKRIYELGKRLIEGGDEVHVFGIKWWGRENIINYEGLILHGVCEPMELYINGKRSISEAIIFSLRLFPSLIKEKFDIIDVSAFPYFSCFSVKLASILRNTPIVITWHEVWGDYWYEYLRRWGFFGKLIESQVSRLASKTIAVSSMTKKNLMALGVKNIHIIPNGIDLERIAEIPPSPEKCDILFAGRLIREKNVDVLLEAVDWLRNSLPDVKCCIIGDGPEKERLLICASERNLLDNVKFLGFLDYDEVIARMKSAKVFALPSCREGFGMVVIEAFACGLPVVTVDEERNAARDLVGEGMGFVVAMDSGKFEKAIRTLIEDNEVRRKMSSRVLDAAKGYDWERIVKQLRCFYRN
jgi:glycosyltransferase involved in cell wall biosynthesis